LLVAGSWHGGGGSSFVMMVMDLDLKKEFYKDLADSIVKSWIFLTLSSTLRKRLIKANPKTAKDAWDTIEAIFQDNKRTRVVALKGELPHTEPFPDLSTMRSMVSTEEMRIRNKSHSLSVSTNSSAPQVLLTETPHRVQDTRTNKERDNRNNNKTEVHAPTPLKITRVTNTSNMHTGIGFGQETVLPTAFNTMTLQDPVNANWHMDTGASSHLNSSAHNLSTIFNSSVSYPTVLFGGRKSIPSPPHTPSTFTYSIRPLHINMSLSTPNIGQKFDFMCRQFVRENKCTIEFDEFGFSVKDFRTRQILLRCDSTGDLYPITSLSYPQAFLVGQQTWHQRLGHPGSDVLHTTQFLRTRKTEPISYSAQTLTTLPEPNTRVQPLEDNHVEFPAEEQPFRTLMIHLLLSPPEIDTVESEWRIQREYKMKRTEKGISNLAPADSTVIPADEPVFPHEGTEPIIPPPSTDITIGARITVRPQISISLPQSAEIERPILAMTTPSTDHHLSYIITTHCRIASTQALIDAVTAALPPPSLPPLPPSLSIPSPVDRRDDIPESEQPPRKRLHLSTICSRYEIGESSTARPARGQGIDYGFVSMVDAEERRQGIRDVGYGIRDTWVDPAEAVPEIAPMTVGEVNTRVVELAELHERDTQDLYALLEDAQDGRSRISQRVDMNSQRVDLLMGDRMTLQETVWMVEEEAYASREAWAHSIGLSQATHQELQTHRDHVYAHETYLQAHQTQLQLQSTLIQTQHQVHETRFQMQHAELAALRETDRRRQDQMVETLRVIRDMRREMSDMQAELLALREQQRRARQPPGGFWRCR
ncbi:hypothetical protein Tco_0404891, partial [Tanacetum coccineum]